MSIVEQRLKRQQPPAKAPAAQEPDTGSSSVLPLEIKVGDRFTDQGFEWEVVTHSTAMHGAKTLRARVVRPGLPQTEREAMWQAHERVTIRRRTKK